MKTLFRFKYEWYIIWQKYFLLNFRLISIESVCLISTSWSKKWSISCSVMCNSLRPDGLQLQPSVHRIFQAKENTGVGSHFLLQGISPTRGLNPVLHIAGRLADSLLSEPPGKPGSWSICMLNCINSKS